MPTAGRLLLLLPTRTYRTKDFLEAARGLGVEIVVGSEEKSTLEGHRPENLMTLDFRDPPASVRRVLEFHRDRPVDAVVSVDEPTALVAAAVADALSLRHHPVESAAAAMNKRRMREVLHDAGIAVPSFATYSVDDDPASIAPHTHYPCVLKPVALSASRGVIRADRPEELVSAFVRIRAILESPDIPPDAEATRQIIIEDYIPGFEVALEGLMDGSELRVLALFDKPDPLEGPFFEETIYVTPSRLPEVLQSEIAQVTGRAAAALGLRDGPIHAELRVDGEEVRPLEIAARSIGGLCSRALRFGAGTSLEEVIIRHALRMEIESLEREDRAAGVMMLPVPRAGNLVDVRGQDEALAVTGVDGIEITAHKGQALMPLPEGSRYLGFIFARAETPEEVEAALRESFGRLEIVMEDSPGTGISRGM